MKINLDKYLEIEIAAAFEIFKATGDWKEVDYYALERKFKTPEGDKNLILVLYNKLLSYTYVWHEGAGVYDDGRTRRSEDVTTPWIACRIELEGDQNTKWHSEILNELKEWLDDKFPWKPFYDEDAPHGIYSRKCSSYSRDWTQYVFYINPDYPKGWWENHTLG